MAPDFCENVDALIEMSCKYPLNDRFFRDRLLSRIAARRMSSVATQTQKFGHTPAKAKYERTKVLQEFLSDASAKVYLQMGGKDMIFYVGLSVFAIFACLSAERKIAKKME